MAAVRSAKQLLRKELKTRLAALTDAEKQRQSEVVTGLLLDSAAYRDSKRVSVFLSMHDEVRTLPIVREILASQRACFIPRYHGPSMDMVRLHSMEDYDSLPETAWKIKQPPAEEQREDALDTGGLDLVLMPGLGFTRAGERLGRGKGYYDNYLHQCEAKMGRRPRTLALAYFEQICETIPTSEHDVPVDLVLFEDKDKQLQ